LKFAEVDQRTLDERKKLEMENRDMPRDTLCAMCGETASECDQSKWSCLVCGNKIFYAPPPTLQAFDQRSVKGRVGAYFAFDSPGAIPPKPVFEKKPACGSSHFDKMATKKRSIRVRPMSLTGDRVKIVSLGVLTGAVLFALGSILVAEVSVLIFAHTVRWMHAGVLAALGVAFGLLLLRSLRAWCSASTHLRITIAQLERLRNRDQQITAKKDGDVAVASHYLPIVHE
jgi:hypothetical protein